MTKTIITLFTICLFIFSSCSAQTQDIQVDTITKKLCSCLETEQSKLSPKFTLILEKLFAIGREELSAKSVEKLSKAISQLERKIASEEDPALIAEFETFAKNFESGNIQKCASAFYAESYNVIKERTKDLESLEKERKRRSTHILFIESLQAQEDCFLGVFMIETLSR